MLVNDKESNFVLRITLLCWFRVLMLCNKKQQSCSFQKKKTQLSTSTGFQFNDVALNNLGVGRGSLHAVQFNVDNGGVFTVAHGCVSVITVISANTKIVPQLSDWNFSDVFFLCFRMRSSNKKMNNFLDSFSRMKKPEKDKQQLLDTVIKKVKALQP